MPTSSKTCESHPVVGVGRRWERPLACSGVISKWSRNLTSVFISGEPVLSGGRGQDEWQEAIRQRVHPRIQSPRLTFVVSGLKRRGHPFDLDNLVHPVLMTFEEPIDRVSARLYVGTPAGLLIEDRPLDELPGPCPRSIYLESHSRESAHGRSGIPEIALHEVLTDHEGLGLHLAFDSRDIPIRHGWFGPTEAVVDDLAPWFGTYTSRQLIADHRIRDLRIERGLNPSQEGVAVSVWYVPDDEVLVPRGLTALLS